MNRTRHLRTVSRDSPVRAATRVSGATPPSSAQASTTRARSASDCDAVRLRDKASSDARSASDKTSGTSFGLGTCQAYNLQTFQRLRTLAKPKHPLVGLILASRGRSTVTNDAR